MENFCKGLCLGMVAGAVVAGTIVAKNKEMAAKIRKGLGVAEEKMQEAKEFIEEKIEEGKSEFDSNKTACEQGGYGCYTEKSNFDSLKNGANKDFGKKSKN